MLAAWLHHKLRTREDRAVESYEDLVTGTVFGLLEYLPWEHGLGRFLDQVGLEGTTRGEVLFWPFRDGTEPDVVLVGTDWSVLVEAKVGADFGDAQLGREWRWLLDHCPADRVRLVAVGPDGWSAERLRGFVAEDLATLGAPCRLPESHEVTSVRWHELLPKAGGLRPHEERLHTDLEVFLRRTGLLRTPFSGWSELPPPPALGEAAWYGTTPRGLWADLPTPPTIPSPDWYVS